MDSTARRSGGVLEGLYRVLMRRTSVYATFVIAGAFLGERVRVPISSPPPPFRYTYMYTYAYMRYIYVFASDIVFT